MRDENKVIGYVISGPSGYYDTDKVFTEHRNAKAICKAVNDTLIENEFGGPHYCVGSVFTDGSVEF